MEKINTFITLAIFFVLACTSHLASGQVISGKVTTESGIPLKGAIVNLLTKKDSIFYSFVRTNQTGDFKIKRPIDTGSYLLVFLYPKHTDVSIAVNIAQTSQNKDLGIIKLPLNSIFLEEVTVTARSLMKVKGDTLEYDIKGLKLEPNSRVEDVINQLPGMQITRGGQIYSHGKMVERVLVDGEPFFGNDPTLVTKNIRSDIVDKIQVYDAASQKERITGIKDNNKARTIDIKLKENKKKGIFGSVQAGYLNKHYNNMLMLNKFDGNEKIFGYGVLSNTGKLGAGYKNMSSANGGLGSAFDASTGNFKGEGKPTVYSSGISYSNSWNGTKLNTNVSAKGLTVEGNKEVYTVMNSAERTRENKSMTDFKKTTHEQDFELVFEKNGESKFFASINGGHEKLLNEDTRNYRLNDVGEEQNVSFNQQSSNTKEHKFNTNMLFNWSTKIKKDGRRISIGFQPNLMTTTNTSYVDTDFKINDPTKMSRIQLDGNTHEHNLDFNLSYTEPLLGGILVNSFENKNYISGGRSNVTSADEQYKQLLNGDFRYNYGVNKIKTAFKTTIERFSTEIGTALSLEKSDFDDRKTHSKFIKNYTFLQPSVDLQFKWSNNHWLKGQYNRFNIAPTYSLVQPFANANDLVNIYSGNVELQPKTTNRFNLDYHNFKLSKMRAFNANFEYSISYNDFGYAITTDEQQNFIKPINILKPTSMYHLSASFGKEVDKKKDYLWLQLDGRQSTGYNYVNGTENRLNNTFIKLRPSLSFTEVKGLRFNLSMGPTYEKLDYSRNKNMNFEGLGAEGDGGIFLKLPLLFRLEQRFNYVYQPKNKLLGSSLNQLLWDVSLIKTFGKENKFTAEISANDLLNQNRGLQRIYGNTGFTENRYTTIKRFFLLSLKWDLNKMGN